MVSPGATHVSLVFAQHNNAMLQQIPSFTDAQDARVLLTLPNPCKFELHRGAENLACSRTHTKHVIRPHHATQQARRGCSRGALTAEQPPLGDLDLPGHPVLGTSKSACSAAQKMM